jgi:hypothetical protein
MTWLKIVVHPFSSARTDRDFSALGSAASAMVDRNARTRTPPQTIKGGTLLGRRLATLGSQCRLRSPPCISVDANAAGQATPPLQIARMRYKRKQILFTIDRTRHGWKLLSPQPAHLLLNTRQPHIPQALAHCSTPEKPLTNCEETLKRNVLPISSSQTLVGCRPRGQKDENAPTTPF